VQYTAGDCCGAELIAAPPPRADHTDPVVPRTQTCNWVTPGTALAFPLSDLGPSNLSEAAFGAVEASLCAQLLATLLPDRARDNRPPERAALAQLSSAASLMRLDAGKHLYTVGSSPSALFFLIRGGVEITDSATPSRPGLPPANGVQTEPGPLGAHAVLSECRHTESVRVAPTPDSSVIVSIPALHANTVLLGSPALRGALVANAHMFPKAGGVVASKPRGRHSIVGGASSHGKASGAMLMTVDWHRTRGANLARKALMNIPAGLRSGSEERPWTSIIDGLEVQPIGQRVRKGHAYMSWSDVSG
jgi:hypothetical protein